MGVLGVAVASGAAMRVDGSTPAGVTISLLVAMVVSNWLPVAWFDTDDSTQTILLVGLWVTVAAVLLPAPTVVLLAGGAQLAALVLTCALGDGVQRPPFRLDSWLVNLAIGTLGGLAAALAAAQFEGTVAASVAAGLGAAVTGGAIVVVVTVAHTRELSVGRLRGLLRAAAFAAGVEIAGAILVVAAAERFGVVRPAAVVTVLVLAFWFLSAELHHHRTVTAGLLDLTTTATAAATVTEVGEAVASTGRRLLGRDVELRRGSSTWQHPPVVSLPVLRGDWQLHVGHGPFGRPLGTGRREQGAIAGLVAAAEAALLAAQAREDAVTQAMHDELTGLRNRRGFEPDARRVVERAFAAGHHATIAYLDLDGFKRVNDEFGHDVGDEVLVAVAEALRSRLRPTDLIARLGGDEFAVVFGDQVRLDEAQRRIEAALTRLPHGVEASVGVADARGDLAEGLRRADEEMYAAKSARTDRASGASLR